MDVGAFVKYSSMITCVALQACAAGMRKQKCREGEREGSFAP
jgi:hypothetical protein